MLLAAAALRRDLLLIHSRADQHRYAADWLDAFWKRNEPSIQRFNTRLRAIAAALAIQMVLWAIAIVTTVGGAS